MPIHIQRDEADYVRKTTGVGDDHLALHEAATSSPSGRLKSS